VDVRLGVAVAHRPHETERFWWVTSACIIPLVRCAVGDGLAIEPASRIG
jgi:hypothetical protein